MKDFKAFIAEMVAQWAQRKGVQAAVDEALLEQQAKVAESMWQELQRGGRLLLLKAPTASGKTEVFTSLYLYQFEVDKFHSARLFVIEPVHALLRQMRERIETYAEKFRISVGEDHGEVAKPTYLYGSLATLTTVDTYAYAYLAKRVAKWQDEEAETGRYTMPVGLMAHALNILDEAHLIQDEVFLGPRVMAKIICPMVKAGANFVVATATMPTAILQQLEKECGDEAGVYKLPPKRRHVATEPREKALDPGDVDCATRTLVVANTVERARSLYKKIKERCPNAHLIHSMMTRGEREETLRKIADAAKRGENYVLVGTQAVEVGLDLDFDVLHTEAAPLDSLIQRLGRVGRRGNKAEAYVYTQLDTHLPYLRDVLESSKAYISQLGDAINDVDKTTELLDQVYTPKRVEEMAQRGEELYVETVDYIANLHLFAPPPPREAWLRPSLYTDIYVFKTAPPTNQEDWTPHMVRLTTSLVANYDKTQKLKEAAQAAECQFEKVGADRLSDVCREGCIYIPAQRLAILCPNLDALYDDTGLKLQPQEAPQTKRKRTRSRRT